MINKIKYVALCLLLSFCGVSLVGCTAGEIAMGTQAGIETVTSFVPVEYSEALAKNVYTSAVGNSKLQKTIKLTMAQVLFENGAAITRKDTINAWYKNNEQSTQVKLNMGTNNYYVVSFSGQYYTLYVDTKQYEIGSEVLAGGESAFMLYNIITGGMCYNNANSYITSNSDGSDGQIAQITVKNNLITGFLSTDNDDDGNVRQVITATYIYNENLDDYFTECPTTFEDMTAEYTLKD